MDNELILPGREEDLIPFLARHMALYTSGDHSSVPTAMAQELFTSIRFTLAQGPEGGGDLEERFAAGLAVTRKNLDYGKRLWRAVCGSLPRINNLSRTDTLRSMGGFFRQYDCRFFAHQIPCDIDYQLSQPVPDELEGINYVNRYLTHLAVEHDILNRFDPGRAAALLKTVYGDYCGLLVNLYEPVATNALALAVVGGDVAGLSVSAEEREEFARLLVGRPEVLKRGAEKLSTLLDLRSVTARRYLARTAAGLLPRIRETDLSGVFPTIP